MDTESFADRRWVQGLLRGGLGLAVLLMLMGIGMHLCQILNQTPMTAVRIQLSDLTDSSVQIADRLLGWGIFVLAVTPAVRVVMLMLLWAKERDWKYAGVSLFVLMTLALSVILGKGG